MSRRNRYFLDSSPLPPLPEVDTSSTIDSISARRVVESIAPSQSRNPSHEQLQSIEGTHLRTEGVASHVSGNKGPIPEKQNNSDQNSILLTTLNSQGIAQARNNGMAASTSKVPRSGISDNDGAFQEINLQIGENNKKQAKPTNFLDDIRTTFVRGFSRQRDDTPRTRFPTSSVYESSPPIINGDRNFTATEDLRNARSQNSLTNSNANAGFTFDFLETPYSLQQTQARVHKTGSDLSIPDGSTVGNIYKHYLRDDALADFSDEGSLSDFDMTLPEMKPASPGDFNSQNRAVSSSQVPKAGRSQTPTFSQKLQLRAERHAYSKPPQFSLPAMPQDTRHLGPSSSSGIPLTNSYGNTRDLLNLTPGSHGSNDNNLHARYTAQRSTHGNDHDSREHDYVSVPDNVQNMGPKVYIDHGDGKPVIDQGDDFEKQACHQQRVPLEREVSNALRRASGQSTYSAGSVTDSIIDRYRHFGQRVFSGPKEEASELSLPEIVPYTPPSDTSNEAIVHNPSDQPSTFYDQGVLSPSWVHGSQHNVVRVPINHHSSVPDSPPQSPQAGHQTYLKQPMGRRFVTPTQPDATDDGNNDWETVGTRTSLFDGVRDKTPDFGLIGGMVGRAGSSIADVSDAEFASTVEIEDLRSTQRIAQHPAQSGYRVDYRQRSLKDTKAPIFAPRYRIHNVNGFLANSNRLHPQTLDSSQAHLPNLSKTHSNPFKRTPPEVLSSHIATEAAQTLPEHRDALRYKPSFQTLNTEIGEEDYTTELVPPSALQHLSEEERRRKALQWMEHFDEHKLTLPTHNDNLGSPCPDRESAPNSFYRAIQAAASNVSGLFSSSSLSGTNDTKLRHLKLSTKHQIDGTTLGQSSTQAQNMTKKPYSQLRKLTLVQNLHPSSAQTTSTLGTDQNSGSEDFVYRSPLAPPKQRRWKDLYSPSQLFGFQQAARADALDNNGHARQASSMTDSTPALSSRKHLFERPTLRIWQRDEATSADLTHQKRNCSIVVLCVCTVFPPLLLVYIFGGLDGIMAWWTGGLYTGYAKSQKRLALIFLVAWSVAVFIGLIVFLAYWFTHLR